MSDSSKSPKVTARQIMNSMLESVVLTDAQNRIINTNPAFTRSTGYTLKEVFQKRPSILKSGKHRDSYYKRMWTSIQKNGFWQGEIWNKRKDGTLYLEWLTISVIKNSKGIPTNYLAVFTDITKKKKAEETIKHMAFYDPLTELPNRNLFHDRLKQALTHAQKDQDILAVMFLDLDRVKIINDTLGHATGDKLLIEVAKRLQSCLREEDTVARLGGDEFMLLFPHINKSKDIAVITQKILEAVKVPFFIDDEELYITASIGISLFPQDGSDSETLSKNADTAMYRAKKLGRNNFQVFTPAMKEEVFEQLTLGNNIKKALDREEFVLHYQPQIDLATGEIIGAEALVRWNHPELGLIPPSRFIPWAEESGLIIPLGKWVLYQACLQNYKWQKAGYAPLRIGVNLSARQFEEENLVKTVDQTLSQTGLLPSYLDLELTESILMDSTEAHLWIPHDLRAIGVSFSIDDFGKGYSSLSYLRRFPVNTLKMDQSFVQDLGGDSQDAAIASAVIALGHSLKLSVLAEGVETDVQLSKLKELKCDLIQGFLFSKPITSQEMEAILKEKRHLNSDNLFKYSFS